MRIAIISDVHGNFPALRAGLNTISRFKVDRIHFLGDAVGYLPWVNDVIRLLKKEKIVCQKGNHDMMLLGNQEIPKDKEDLYKIKEARDKLAEEDLRYINSWPEKRQIEVDKKKILLVHGSPEDPINGYIYPDNSLDSFKSLEGEYDAIFMGHTHLPFVKRSGKMLVVNVGSCGLPRDNGSLGSFCIFDTTAGDCEIYRFPINTEATIKAEKQVHPKILELVDRKEPSTQGKIVR